MSLRKSPPIPTTGTSRGSSCVRVSGSVAAGSPSSAGTRRAVMGSGTSCGRKEFGRVDRLAETAYFEMELDLVGVGVAHLAYLLSLAHLLSLFDEDIAIVRVRRQIRAVVFDDDQLAVPAQTSARVDNASRRTGDHGLARFTRDIDTLEVRRVGKAGDHFAGGGPHPLDLVVIDFGNAGSVGMWRQCRRRRRLRCCNDRRWWRHGHWWRDGRRRSGLHLRERLFR